MKSKDKVLTVYYDGLCHLCSREIDHYRKQVGVEQILFFDITRPDFNAQKENVDPFEVHRVLHARKWDGSLAKGVDAFVAIWAVLPKYRWASQWAQKIYVRPFLSLGYHMFAAVRPLLPRKKNLCAASPYCEIQTPGEKT